MMRRKCKLNVSKEIDLKRLFYLNYLKDVDNLMIITEYENDLQKSRFCQNNTLRDYNKAISLFKTKVLTFFGPSHTRIKFIT